MSDEDESLRMARIRRLLHELEYEVTRGIMEREIDPEIGFQFFVPSGNGVVKGEFRTRRSSLYDAAGTVGLRLVKPTEPA